MSIDGSVLGADELAERSFVFLQGPLSPLYRRVGCKLEAAGAQVCRINFCLGDALHWPSLNTVPFRGRPRQWPAFFRDVLRHLKATDLVCHGDQRLYHRLAIEMARRDGVRVHVSEMGLLRPGYMTLCRNGLGSACPMPRDPIQVRAQAKMLRKAPVSGGEFPTRFTMQAVPDVVYNLANYFDLLAFPHYQKHTLYNPVVEYGRWIAKLVGRRHQERRAAAVMKRLRDKPAPRFLFPLQLEGDFQIRTQSQFGSMIPALRHVMESFARSAPASAHLIVKEHPLDAGFEDFEGVLKRVARSVGCAQRVHFVQGGPMPAWLALCHGVVTVNSTAGLEALQDAKPVKCLSPTLYDLPGLTDQQPLDAFWRNPVKPEMDLLQDFLKVLIAQTQVPGSIHHPVGLTTAVESFVSKLACTFEPPQELSGRSRDLQAHYESEGRG